MRILFCVEFYYPSVGGAQEVVRQLAERMVSHGHAVSIATSKIPTRKSSTHNGVKVEEFAVSGNRVRGMQGEVERYQEYLEKSDFDIVMFYAAQQWTFDAAWAVMPSISAHKVLVPCGYSGLFQPSYQTYFNELPAILRVMDVVVYHAENYRDINFGKSLGLDNDVLIPNGADVLEFSVAKSSDYRQSICDSSTFILLTVGTMTGMKGHMELARAYADADFGRQKTALILNGNTPELHGRRASTARLFTMLARQYGLIYALRHGLKMFLRHYGVQIGEISSIQDWAERINRNQGELKRVIVTDLPRDQLIQAYLNADLFVFASNVEYSPLVLFEACAAGLPFLSVPVGNAAEIAAWTGGGELCEAPVDERGFTRALPSVLARRIEALVEDPEKLARLGRNGLMASRRRYNWDAIAGEYEDLFIGLIEKSSLRVANDVATPAI